jgi:hypothetical protein
MRFMMFMYPGIAEEDWQPDAEAVARMGKYNEELSQAGVLLALDGLRPPSDGARVSFAEGRAKIIDGPYAEAKEVIGGYWLIDVKDRDEAVAWATRIPGDPGNVVEVRRVYEMSDFSADVQAAAELSQVPPEQTTA